MTDTVEKLVVEALAGLDLAARVRLLTGATFWRTRPAPEVGLEAMVLSDGPAGVRGERADEREPSASLPCPSALAATWDESLLRRVGRLVAAQARAKGVHVVLGPTVNLHRSPLGGRHFECLAEDPLLTARAGGALVRGIQDGGVAATVKHYVANESETDRFTVDARVDERALREVYLAPFESLVTEAGAWAVMAAYNSVAGVTMTENPLLRDPLKDLWGFDGVVVSDWFATRSAVPAALSGLDLVMPGPFGPWGPALVAAVESGEVPAELVEDKARRLLRLAARVGALTDAAPDGSSVATPAPRAGARPGGAGGGPARGGRRGPG
ncbi:glycoside hydrolase family 3 N-terminal domain-containing protein, partial [Frankia sp. AgB1.9]|uniref:glycoside hydrolase family 3 protein n=1 Tax=Frankia sp. AgB1.9 TaxID=1836968 RepID=UPI0027DB37CF